MILADVVPTDPGPDVLQFLQFGVVGLVLVMILFKVWIVPAWTLKDARAAHDAELALLREANDGLKADVVDLKRTVQVLQDAYSDKVIPALVDANRLTAAYVAELARRAS